MVKVKIPTNLEIQVTNLLTVLSSRPGNPCEILVWSNKVFSGLSNM